MNKPIVCYDEDSLVNELAADEKCDDFLFVSSLSADMAKFLLETYESDENKNAPADAIFALMFTMGTMLGCLKSNETGMPPGDKAIDDASEVIKRVVKIIAIHQRNEAIKLETKN